MAHDLTHVLQQFYLKNEESLNYNIVGKLGVLIQQLQKHNNEYQIIESQNGIFHIVFIETKAQNSNIVFA